MSSFNIIIGRSGLKLKEEDLKEPVYIDPKEEAKEFLLNIRKRAEEEAKKIIENAYLEGRKRAEQIIQKAQIQVKEEIDRALKEELEKINQEKERILKEYSSKLSSILDSIEKEKEKIIETYKEDILTFVKVVLEKTFNLVLEDKYKEIFWALLKEALEEVESQKKVKVIINKEDLPIVESLINSIDKKLTQNWEIFPREDVEKGTIKLETPKVSVNNSIIERIDQAKEKIKRLTSL